MTPKKRDLLFRIAAVAASLLVLGEIAVLVLLRETWVDEILASFKSYLILKGELVPFRTGLFDYAPLVVPTYGAVHYFFGPSILAARMLSAVFLAGIFILIFYIARKLAGRLAALAAVLLVASNLLLVGTYASATMYALIMLLVLGVVAVEASALSRRAKTVCAALILGCAVLARTNMTASAVLYLGYLLLTGAPLVEMGVFAGMTALIVVCGYLPVVMQDPRVALSFILGPYVSFGPFASLPRPLIAQGLTRFVGVLVEFIREYLIFLTLFFSSTGAALAAARGRVRSFLQGERPYALLLIFSVGLFAAHYLYWRLGGNLYYANYFMPLMALAAVVGIAKFFPDNRFAYFCLISAIAVSFAANAWRTDVISSPAEESDLARVARGAAFVREHTALGDRILTFDNSLYHVFLADRRTYIPLMQRDFLFLHDADTGRVRSLGFYNLDMIRGWLVEDADYFARQREHWPSSFIRRPFWGAGSEDTAARLKEVEAILKERYDLIGVAYNVYPRKYTEGNDGGTLELYRRKKAVMVNKK